MCAQTGLPRKRTSSVLLVTTLDVLTDAMEVSFAVVLDSVLVSSQNMSVAYQCFLCLGRRSCSQCQQVRLGLRGSGAPVCTSPSCFCFFIQRVDSLIALIPEIFGKTEWLHLQPLAQEHWSRAWLTLKCPLGAWLLSVLRTR